jgi:hypothetical protein
MGDKKVKGVRAREYRTPHQPAESIAPYGMWIELSYEDGSNAMIRSVGTAETKKVGTCSGCTDRQNDPQHQLGSDYIELERKMLLPGTTWKGPGIPTAFWRWANFLVRSRPGEPFHSAQHSLLSCSLPCCRRSSDQDGLYSH